MRRLLLCLAIGLANCEPNNDEILKKIEEDPVNAFLVHPFGKPKLAFQLERNDRLPRHVVVHSYDIRIEPFFDYLGFEYDKSLRDTFNGETKIVFSVLQPTTQIVLASSVDLQAISLTLGRQRIKVLDYETKANSLLVLRTAEELAPRKNYTLNFKYSSRMQRAVYGGVFTADYRNPEGNWTALLATQFETISARKAFPCFDDPWFKSVFHISLIHPRNAKVYSNEQIAEQRYFDEQRLLTRFKPSPKMSTYLVAFAIGDFEEVEAYSKSGVLNRAISVRGRKPFLRNGALTGAAVVDAMEGLVNVSYPLKKLDHLDSVALLGAMENWGLIIYGGTVYERLGKNMAELVLDRRIICHETAHQWFGNLVTADRWGWEFIHESFATFFETKALLDPDFMYLAEIAQVPLIRNAVEGYSKARHPIVDDVGRFDRITYAIGGALLTSVRHALGDNFYKGLHIFLTENKYGSAGLDTLIESFIKVRKAFSGVAR
uniref:Peptidase_M1 domain-containing protein n=1 Tax=Bursaphelenchus xylophilus TaxID=6326 RepID=A0A1I7S1N6_BURXY